MISELILSTTLLTLAWNWENIKLKRRWKQITYSKSKFTNRLGKTLKLWKIKNCDGYDNLQVELPYGYTFKEFQDDLDIFKQGLHYSNIQLCQEDNNVIMRCIKNYEFKEFKPIKLPPNKILIADNLGKPIVVNMNNFPHILIGGDTGTGKSRIFFCILCNLVNTSDNFNLYLLQLRKNDLGVFKECKQTTAYATNLPEVFKNLKEINDICIDRESIIDCFNGINNIEDYNKANPNNKLNYIYVCVDEFSFLNISNSDTPIEKKIKKACLSYIKNIVNAGRSSGVFLIVSLQKPTKTSIPTDIKSQLCTRISLKILDNSTSIVILDNDMATKLTEREIIVRTKDIEQGFTYTIEHSHIIDAIKDKMNFVDVKYAPIKHIKGEINNNVAINSTPKDKDFSNKYDKSKVVWINDLKEILNEVDK